MILIFTAYCIIYSVPIIVILLFVVPLAILSMTNFIKSTYSDANLLSNRKELEISDKFILFKRYSNGKLCREKKYNISELRGYRDVGAYITFKLGTLIDKQVIKFEYESEDIEALRSKLKQITSKPVETSQKGLTVLKTLWFAMLVSLIIVILLGQYMLINEPLSLSNDFPIQTMRYILYTISIVILISIKHFRKIILSRSQNPVTAKYTTLTIVSLALAWSIGIYGLVLAMIGNRMIDLYLLIFVSASAMYYFRPKDSELDAMMKQE